MNFVYNRMSPLRGWGAIQATCDCARPPCGSVVGGGLGVAAGGGGDGRARGHGVRAPVLMMTSDVRVYQLLHILVLIVTLSYNDH